MLYLSSELNTWGEMQNDRDYLGSFLWIDCVRTPYVPPGRITSTSASVCEGFKMHGTQAQILQLTSLSENIEVQNITKSGKANHYPQE